MSEKLDKLLALMNEAQAGRMIDDIPVTLPPDPYWVARDAYHKALSEADGVHVPVSATSIADDTKVVEAAKTTRSVEEQLADLEASKTVN